MHCGAVRCCRANLHGVWIGGKCQLAKETIASGFGGHLVFESKGLCADSEEKHEPASDIDTAVVDSLKVLDPKPAD